MFTADLALLQDGRPLIIVEAKARSIPPAFRRAVLQQLRQSAERSHSTWSLLVDPESVHIYSTANMDAPVATIATRDITELTGLAAAVDVWGERMLLAGVDRWLRRLPNSKDFLKLHPELRNFLETLSAVDDFATEFRIE